MAILVISKRKFQIMSEMEKQVLFTPERRTFKDKVIASIKVLVEGIRWGRAAKLLRVLDEMIYMLSDRGFSFNGRETLMKKCGVGASTIDKAMQVIKQCGEFVVAYRENPDSNGCKTPVIIYKKHPNFSQIALLLGIETTKQEVKQDAEQEVEKPRKPYQDWVEKLKNVATYSFTHTNTLDIRKDVNPLDNFDLKFVPSYVDKEFAKATKPFFTGDIIYKLWGRVQLLTKQFEMEIPVEQSIEAFKEAVFAYKNNRIKSGQSDDAFIKFFFGVVRNKFEDRIAEISAAKRTLPLYNWLEDATDDEDDNQEYFVELRKKIKSNPLYSFLNNEI